MRTRDLVEEIDTPVALVSQTGASDGTIIWTSDAHEAAMAVSGGSHRLATAAEVAAFERREKLRKMITAQIEAAYARRSQTAGDRHV